jgi:hypothetical protein
VILRITITILGVALGGIPTGAQTQAAIGCNPETPRYAEWAAAQHFPVHLSQQAQQALSAKLSQLQLGATRDEVKTKAGAPDYAADGSSAPNAIACMWIYNFDDSSASDQPKDKKVVLLGFTADGKLAILAPNQVPGLRILQLTDKSCTSAPISPESRLAKDLAAGKPYIASSDRQQRIRTAYVRLSIGDNIDVVESLLGTPDAVHVTSRGHIGTATFVNEPCKRQLEYVLRQSSTNPVDPATVAIYLTFDEQGKLFWGSPQNVEGLKTIGSPTP